jgi:AraC family transcriptional regulator
MTLLHIKNMVCNRCVLAVENLLTQQQWHVKTVTLGEAVVEEDLTNEQLTMLDEKLVALGFERLDDKRTKIVEGIKNIIVKKIHYGDPADQLQNWSTVLEDSFEYDYNYLSNLFSSIEGITLEQFIIRQKIERVKELLHNDELTLSEIADLLGYSSVAHLSSQFKKVTGYTPSSVKKSNQLNAIRKSLDDVR